MVANSWCDFRDNPADDEYYDLRQSYFQFDPSGVVRDQNETPASSEATFWPANVWYGDIDTTAMSPLHAAIARQFSVGGSPNAIVYLWSPDAYLAF